MLDFLGFIYVQKHIVEIIVNVGERYIHLIVVYKCISLFYVVDHATFSSTAMLFPVSVSVWVMCKIYINGCYNATMCVIGQKTDRQTLIYNNITYVNCISKCLMHIPAHGCTKQAR